MNAAVYEAAIRAGCSRRQSELLATIVESRKLSEAAAKLGMAESTAKNHLVAVRQRLKVHHNAAVIAKILS